MIIGLWNLAVWGIWRWDKRLAGQRARRVPERILVGLAWLGGSAGALLAMYAHRQRHKTRKAWIVAMVGLAALTQIATLAVWLR